MNKFSSVLFLVAGLQLTAADTPKTPPVRGFCIPAPSPNRLDEFIKFIEQGPMLQRGFST